MACVLPGGVAVFLLAGLGAAKASAQEQKHWTDTIALHGDFRLRYEAIYEDGREDRERGRYRAHFGASGQVREELEVFLVLATNRDNPVSNNKTFNGQYRIDDIGVDLAYVNWSANDDVNVYGGKMINPLFRPGGDSLVWDSDLNPQGVAISYKTGAFFGTAAGFVVEERSSSDDSLLLAVQGGVRMNLSATGKLTAGLGYYDYTDTIGNEPFFSGRARGNSVDAQGNLIFDYNEFELFAQYATRLGKLPFMVFADFVQNSEADSHDSGYAFGVGAGKAKTPGTWQASWAYRDIQADAVIGTFNDSDFGGGGTDASGHIIKGKYVVSERWFLGGTLFINKVEQNAGSEHDYSRLQLDIEFKF